jgi:hypothetical protein
MTGDLPCPELDDMTIGISDVGCAAPSITEGLNVNALALPTKVFDQAIELGITDMQSVVDVFASRLAGEWFDRRKPEADSGE